MSIIQGEKMSEAHLSPKPCDAVITLTDLMTKKQKQKKQKTKKKTKKEEEDEEEEEEEAKKAQT